MRFVRQQTDDGAELVDFILKVFRGQLVEKLRPSLNQRIAAATWLADRALASRRSRLTTFPTDPRSCSS